MKHVRLFENFISEVYDEGSTWWPKLRGGSGTSHMAGATWSFLPKQYKDVDDKASIKAIYDRLKSNPVFNIEGKDWYFEHTDDNYAYFVGKDYIDSVDISKFKNAAHFVENYDDEYLQITLDEYKKIKK